jgi:hypothetical protein
MKNLLTKLFFIMVVLSTQSLFAQTYSGGLGTSPSPYLISTEADLIYLATAVNGGSDYSLDKYFQQTIDITLASSWTPIGTDASAKRFQGTYDGNSHKVIGMTIAMAADAEDQGFFGRAFGATILNLGVEGVNISSGGTGANRIGGLVGLAGQSTISNCYSTGNVLAGNGTSSFFVGGLIGESFDNTILNCYSTAAVSGGNQVGGLIGGIEFDAAQTIGYCYSSGSVTSGGVIGGLIGFVVAGGTTINSCYWDNQTSGQSSSAGGTGKTTIEMQTISTYSTWDQTGTIWRIASGYPFLAWQNPSGGTPMPVELTSFTSTVSKSGVTLRWSTATEINNYGFNVERRAVNSASSWVKIGFVAGHGTSNSVVSYSYTDAGLASGRYAYRLKQIDNGGAFKYSQSVEQEVSLTPAVIGLSQNYPNPFNPSTLIIFSVANTEQAKLVVYNILGQPVVTLFEGVAIGQQTYKLSFDASNLATGVYFYKLESPSRTDVRRMQLLK